MSVTTLNYNPAYNSGASFSWSSVTFSSIDGGLTYTGSPTTFSSQVPGASDLTGVTIGNIVTSIGATAFLSCSALTSIVIPNSVLSIGDVAFLSCTGLTSATIGTGVTSIGESAFNICGSLLSIVIPDSVLTIGDSAFQSGTGLTSVTIGTGVTSIGLSAFQSCTSLASIVIPNSVPSIGQSAFESCTLLTSIAIGTGVTSIGNSAFYSCSNLESIVIPDSVLTIGSYVFSSCTALTSIAIGTGVTSIGIGAFSSCTALISITFESPSQLETIYYDAFLGCPFAAIIIPNSVQTIGSGVFHNCSNLSLVTFESVSQVQTIGDIAFKNCTLLTSITIPNSLTSIGTDAFQNCTDLATVYIYDAEAQILNPLWNSPTPNPPGISDFYGAPTLAFLAPPPNITGISPSGGGKNGDTLVTITGAFFTGTTSVTFGVNEATSITVVSDTEITCITPAHAPGSVDVIVTTTEGGSSEPITFTYDITCFKEGSKILTDKGYMLIQDLRKGDLVKTIFSGFKKIEHIGHSKMYHNVNDIRSTDKLYRCSTSDYPELTEDLIITGGHSILINDFKDQEQKEKTKDLLTDNYVTERHYRLPACVDDRTKIFEEQGVHTIWHFSLENTDYLKNYGVYANGLLVESTSNRMMVELSGLTLLE